MLLFFIETTVEGIDLAASWKGFIFWIIVNITHHNIMRTFPPHRTVVYFWCDKHLGGLLFLGVWVFYLQVILTVSGGAYSGLGDLLLVRPSLWAGVLLLTCVLTLLLLFNLYALLRFMHPCRDGLRLFRKSFWADALVWPALTAAFKLLICSDAAGLGYSLNALFNDSVDDWRGFNWELAALAAVWATIWLLYLETEKIKQLEALLEGKTIETGGKGPQAPASPALPPEDAHGQPGKAP